MDLFETRTKAWIGDAVLALYSREWILRQSEVATEQRSDVFIHMTSNEFLACIGQPTQVEADIGEIYQDQGLEAAFAFIETNILPTFKKQLANRRKGGEARKRKK